MDDTEKKLLNLIQTDFPLSTRPFKELGSSLGITEAETIERIRRLKDEQIIRQISAIFDTRRLGYHSSLVAMRIDPERVDEAAEVINRHPGVSHNYLREHDFNLWFTIAVPPSQSLTEVVDQLGSQAGALSTRLLPTLRLFKIGVRFDMSGDDDSPAQPGSSGQTEEGQVSPPTEMEIRLVRELQEELPIEPRPFKASADRLGMTEDELVAEAHRMIETGQMRRFAAVLHHRRAGFVANAMTAWAVPDDRVEEIGKVMASFPAVSHCYQRPTYPDWPYNLFTMIHGRSKEETEAAIHAIMEATGISRYAVLYSTKEYKKVRLKLFAG